MAFTLASTYIRRIAYFRVVEGSASPEGLARLGTVRTVGETPGTG
jgi:hypothetical protein